MHSEVSAGRAGVVQVAAWAEHAWLSAGFSTREGGQTSAYGAPGDQNLGFRKEDDPETVASNRHRFLAAVQRDHRVPLLTVGQIHSGIIHSIEDAAEVAAQRLMTVDGKPVLRGDGLIAVKPGLMVGIITADCVPVLLADTRTHVVAAFHAGWRGTLARIVEQGVGNMQQELGTRPEDLIAAIGPGIGPCCFAVGEEVKQSFQDQFAYAPDLFAMVDDQQLHLNLTEANSRQLLDAGVAGNRISVVGECTACTRREGGQRKYFSHRAEKGFTGRMLNVIGALA